MSVSLALQLNVSLSGRYKYPDTAWGEAAKVLNKIVQAALTDGVGANQANVLYGGSGTINSGATLSVALGGPTGLIDVYGRVVAMEKICLLAVLNKNTTTAQTLIVGGGRTDPIASIFGDASDTVVVPPSGVFLLWNPVDGYTIGGTELNLQLAPGGAYAVSYELLAIGRQTF